MKNTLMLLMFLTLCCGCKNGEAAADEMAISDINVTANDEISVDKSMITPPPPAPKVDQVKFVEPVIAKSEDFTTEKIVQKIIKNGNIRFETNDLDHTYTQMTAAVKKHNALIQNDTEGKEYGSIFRRIMVRVPSKNFDVFLTDISKGVSYFDNKEISSQDITEEYIDIDARLKAKKILEARYLELLKKANKVSEMLEIET